ncbi:MAG: transposase [Acidimicrobiales bacterium]
MIAEVGLDMKVFGTPGRLWSWAKVSPRTVQSGRKTGKGATGKGNPYLKAALGQMATGAAKTGTFLGERYRRLVKRMPKATARSAIARSILVIIFKLLSDRRPVTKTSGPISTALASTRAAAPPTWSTSSKRSATR